MSYRNRNQIVLVGVQAAKGTEEALTLSDAIRVQPASFATDIESINTDYVTSGLDEGTPEPGGGGATSRISCYLKGSGAAGTAPDYGILLRGCAMSETVTAADITGTAQAGAASTVTLAAAASAVDDVYRGMVLQITGGTGVGQTRPVLAYDGTTKVATVTPAWATTPDATSEYTLRANVLYRPVSTDTELLTLWRYMRNADASADARLKRMFDAAGTFTLNLPPRALASIEFNLQGRLAASPADVTDPGDPTYAGGTPKAVMGAQAYLGEVALKYSALSFDIGNQVTRQDNPSDTFGYDAAEVVRRAPTGRVTPRMSLISQQDLFGDFIGGQAQHLWVTWGSAAGSRVSVLMPSVRYTSVEEEDVNGHAAEGVPFAASRSDDAVFICVW